MEHTTIAVDLAKVTMGRTKGVSASVSSSASTVAPARMLRPTASRGSERLPLHAVEPAGQVEGLADVGGHEPQVVESVAE